MLSLPPPRDVDAAELALAECGIEAQEIRRLVDEGTATPIYIDYRHAPEWFDGVVSAIETVEKHLSKDPVATLILCEHAVARLEDGRFDDSDGRLMQAIPALERIHAKACERLKLEPLQLAARLAALARASECDAFYDAARTHARALGESGIRALTESGPTS